MTQTGAADPKHKFTGQEEDDSTRLYYYGARYYDPQVGRFITPDTFVQAPSDPQSFNRYAYCRNNPIKFTDPTGNFWFIPALIAFAVSHAAEFAIASIILSIGSIAARLAGENGLAKGLQIAAMITSAFSIVGAAGGAGASAGSVTGGSTKSHNSC